MIHEIKVQEGGLKESIEMIQRFCKNQKIGVLLVKNGHMEHLRNASLLADKDKKYKRLTKPVRCELRIICKQIIYLSLFSIKANKLIGSYYILPGNQIRTDSHHASVLMIEQRVTDGLQSLIFKRNY